MRSPTPLIPPEDAKALKLRFRKDLKEDVTINLFTVRMAGLLVLPGRECPTCPQANSLLGEVAELSPLLHLQTYDFYTQAEETQKRGIDRIPCITFSVAGRGEPRLRFYGVPSGYEFSTLLEDIITLSRGVSPLRVPTRKALRKLAKDVHVQVFVTPT